MRVRATALVMLAAAALPATAGAQDMRGVRERAVRWAVAHAGLRERGTTNRSPQIDRWERDMGIRIGQPWCGAFVHQAFLRAGLRLSARLIDPDRSYRDAQAHRRGLRAIPIHSARRGDLLFFAFRQGLLASHLAIVRGRPRNGSVATVEGNVSHASRLEVRGLQYPVLAARATG
jgi:cell wall-associated NlpC family hydrolase